MIHGCTLMLPIYPLRIIDEGAQGKINKIEINVEKAACSEPESHRPTSMGTLEKIGVNIVSIKELVSRLTHGLG